MTSPLPSSSSTSTSPPSIDESLYSRQLYVLGHEAQARLSLARVLLMGVGGLGVEVAKNLILAGVQSVALLDDGPCRVEDAGASWAVSEADVREGRSRAAAALPSLQPLNPAVRCSVVSGVDPLALLADPSSSFSLLCICGSALPLSMQLGLSALCRVRGVRLVSASASGLFGRCFVDVGEGFTVLDATGEALSRGLISYVTCASPCGVVTCHEDGRHRLSDGDLVTFEEVEGMVELNHSPPRPVRVLSPFTFAIEDTSSYHPFSGHRGYFQQVQRPRIVDCQPLQKQLLHPTLLQTFTCEAQLHALYLALEEHRKERGEQQPLPAPLPAASVQRVIQLIDQLGPRMSPPLPPLTSSLASLLSRLARISSCELSAMCALMGGVVAQEVLKAVTGKFTPLQQWLYIDASHALPEQESQGPDEAQPAGPASSSASPIPFSDARLAHQSLVFGAALSARLRGVHHFVVGAGAIGCEMLKALALMGVGRVTVTDMDLIERSNLNRQFLFRSADVGQLKSVVAAREAMKINPACAITAHSQRVGSSSEEVYDDAFWDGIDCVITALDNVEARLYLDQRCVSEHDTRVLTNHGFLFLSEIEALINGEVPVPVLYACYDKDTQCIVYKPGELVIAYDPARPDCGAPPERWVDFTSAGTRRLWDVTSDDYGSTVPAGSERANYLTVRTTPDHDMYVQLCSTAGDEVGTYWPRSVGGRGAQVPISPDKMPARELVPGYKCGCASIRTCPHGYSHYRMYTGALNGVQPPADAISLTNTDSHSPVFALGLTTKDELDAFLELFGYWLGDGSIGHDTRGGPTSRDAVIFTPKKQRDRTYVREFLARLHLVRGRDYSSCVCKRTLRVCISNRRWFRFFNDDFGVKYSRSQRYNVELALLKQGMHPSQRCPPPVSPVSASVTGTSMPPLDHTDSVLQRSDEPQGEPMSEEEEKSVKEEDEDKEEDEEKDKEEDEKKEQDDEGDDDDDDEEEEEAEDEEQGVPVKSAKWMPDWVMHRLDRRQLRLVIEGLRQADGHSAAVKAQREAAAAGGSDMEGQRCISTSGLGFRDQLIHACLLAGYSSYFNLNHKAGAVRGYDAVPNDGCGIYTEKKMMAALQVDSTRQFKPVMHRYDSWWVRYSEAVSLVLPAKDVRFDGSALRIRQKRELGKGWVAENVCTGRVHHGQTGAELTKPLSTSIAVIKRAKKSGALIDGVWRISSKTQYEERMSGHFSQSPAARPTQPADYYDPHRDGRVWCVRVDHKDQLIFVQRVHRNSAGVVTKVGRSMIVGNCVYYQRAMFDSGTLGSKGSVQSIIPHLTESYGASRDPPEESIPICTLRNFPNKVEHCIQWAREAFEGHFTQTPTQVNHFLINGQAYLDDLQSRPHEALAVLSSVHDALLTERPASFIECVQWGRVQFEVEYQQKVLQLLHVFPPDSTTSEGVPFWSATKRQPQPLTFDLSDPTHLAYVRSAARLRAFVYNLQWPSDEAEELQLIERAVASTRLPSLQVASTNIATTDAEAKAMEEKAALEDAEGASERCAQLGAALLRFRSSQPTFRPLAALEFDKDDDSNGHLRYIAAAANLRARSYRMKEETVHNVKLIAGKIIPAIATTTALVTGLVALELVKWTARRRELSVYRNSTVNLALPFLASAEPLPAATSTAAFPRGEWKWSQWDRIEVDEGRDLTLEQFTSHLRQRFGVDTSMISYGPAMLYYSFGNKKKMKERQGKALSSIVQEVTGKPIPPHQRFLILEACVNVPGGEDVDIPFIRLKFSNDTTTTHTSMQ